MIEVAIKNYLETELKNVPVLLEFPQEVPDEFVLLIKIDGGRKDYVSAATFRLEIRAHSLYGASVLAEKVKDAMFNAISLHEVSSSAIGGERQTSDTANNLYRYDLTYNIYYYTQED